jgi:hypothetical protein
MSTHVGRRRRRRRRQELVQVMEAGSGRRERHSTEE